MVTKRARTLPEFEAPPVIEVLLLVQFAPMVGLRAPALARWDALRDRLSRWQERPPMALQQEMLGVPNQQIYFDFRDEGMPRLRHWFSDESDTNLLQVQDDAIAHNWRRTDNEPRYPRYHTIRAAFEQDLKSFEKFVAEQRLGEFQPRQCEVTYVNEIPLGGRKVSEVLQGWSGETSDDNLPPIESLEIGSHHRLEHEGRPIGRLHVQAGRVMVSRRKGPGQVVAEPILRLAITARGAPTQPGIAGALAWLDLGHEFVVRGFCSVTRTAVQQNEWKRRQ